MKMYEVLSLLSKVVEQNGTIWSFYQYDKNVTEEVFNFNYQYGKWDCERALYRRTSSDIRSEYQDHYDLLGIVDKLMFYLNEPLNKNEIYEIKIIIDCEVIFWEELDGN